MKKLFISLSIVSMLLFTSSTPAYSMSHWTVDPVGAATSAMKLGLEKISTTLKIDKLATFLQTNIIKGILSYLLPSGIADDNEHGESVIEMLLNLTSVSFSEKEAGMSFVKDITVKLSGFSNILTGGISSSHAQVQSQSGNNKKKKKLDCEKYLFVRDRDIKYQRTGDLEKDMKEELKERGNVFKKQNYATKGDSGSEFEIMRTRFCQYEDAMRKEFLGNVRSSGLFGRKAQDDMPKLEIVDLVKADDKITSKDVGGVVISLDELKETILRSRRILAERMLFMPRTMSDSAKY